MNRTKVPDGRQGVLLPVCQPLTQHNMVNMRQHRHALLDKAPSFVQMQDHLHLHCCMRSFACKLPVVSVLSVPFSLFWDKGLISTAFKGRAAQSKKAWQHS
jgi:hypothetical protein